jgi:hypothetical protein
MDDIEIGLPAGESFRCSAVVDHGFACDGVDLSTNSVSYWVTNAGHVDSCMRIWRESPEGQRVTALRADPKTHQELALYLHELYLRHVPVEDYVSSLEYLVQDSKRRGAQGVRDALSEILRYTDY